MELVTVGTGTVAPSATRTSACHWVSRGSLKILLDCGAGALHRLAQFGLPWHQVTHVILSHFHPDHWGELPMLVYALKYTTVPPRQESLVILGPRGVVRLVKQLAEGYGSWLLDPGFPIGILDVQNGEPFPLDAEVSLETFPVPHTSESVALSLTAPEGRLVYTGDTGPSSELARWASGADLLLAECSLPKEMAMDIHRHLLGEGALREQQDGPGGPPGQLARGPRVTGVDQPALGRGQGQGHALGGVGHREGLEAHLGVKRERLAVLHVQDADREARVEQPRPVSFGQLLHEPYHAPRAQDHEGLLAGRHCRVLEAVPPLGKLASTRRGRPARSPS